MTLKGKHALVTGRLDEESARGIALEARRVQEPESRSTTSRHHEGAARDTLERIREARLRRLHRSGRRVPDRRTSARLFADRQAGRSRTLDIFVSNARPRAAGLLPGARWTITLEQWDTAFELPGPSVPDRRAARRRR